VRKVVSKEKRTTFLKGMLMGACDIVPGISAGTIAFITGIYERLINAIKGFSPYLIWDFVLLIFGKGDRGKFRKDVRALDLGFLVPLGLGIMFAILLLSRVISWLLEYYFSYTMVFFVGLILASAKTIFDHIEKHHSANVALMILGLIGGVGLMFAIPANVNPTVVYVFLGGFLAISAMMLPGISGSFILLILGLYEIMLDALKHLLSEIKTVIVFILGAIVGFMTISRVVSWLFKKDKSKTLYFLLGLVVGSLGVPLRSIYVSFPEVDFLSVIIHLVLFAFGILSASLVTHYSKNKYLTNS
jgi:putative membrane protein